MWGQMKEWLRTASIPKDRFLKTDLVSPMIKPDSRGTIFLESKKDMKARGLASPDAADAICVTFAFPVAHRESKAPPRVLKSYDKGAASTGWMSA